MKIFENGSKQKTIAIAAGGGVTLLAALFFMRPQWHQQMAAYMSNDTPEVVDMDAAIIPWCADGLEPIAGGGCFAPAQTQNEEPMLLVYLHGMYSPANVSEELDRQSRVAKLGTEKGYSVLALRGQQGQCSAKEVADYWCWPSNERNEGDGKKYVDGFGPALAVVTTRLEKTGLHPKRYLLGFSNGGYFAGLIATRDLMKFEAFAIAHSGPVEPTTGRPNAPPLLLLTADDDPSNDSMIQFDNELSREHWNHAIVTRDGGHALPNSDIEMALEFFRRTRHETLPFNPPLSTRAPKASPHDAGETASAAPESSTVDDDL